MSANPLPLALDDDASAQKSAEMRREFSFFVRNLAALILVGVVVSWWLLEYTDFFPALGGFFGLAGIFAWVAFLSDLVTKERKAQMQNQLEQRVLIRDTTATYALFALILFGVWVFLHGTLVIIAPGDGSKRVVEIRDGTNTIDKIDIPPGKTVKIPLWTPRRARSLVLKTPGLPELPVTLSSFSLTKVVVPQSFHAQPVVFVLALTGEDAASLGPRPSIRAQIRRGAGGKWTDYDALEPTAYAGENVWVGASVDTEVPAALRERIRLDVPPKALGADKPLRVGDELRVCVMNSEGGELGLGEVKVLDGKQSAFPQELQLKPMSGDENQKRCP
jgi:hypothetical protein